MEGKWAVLSSPARLRVPAMQNGEWDDNGDVTGTHRDLGRYRGEQFTTPQRTHMQHQTTTQAVHTQGSKHIEGRFMLKCKSKP